MDDNKLSELLKAKENVDAGSKLKNQIEKLEDVVKFCDAEIGFMRIQVNFNNDGQVDLERTLGESREVHTAYRAAVKAATLELKAKLENEFNNMNFGGIK